MAEVSFLPSTNTRKRASASREKQGENFILNGRKNNLRGREAKATITLSWQTMLLSSCEKKHIDQGDEKCTR